MRVFVSEYKMDERGEENVVCFFRFSTAAKCLPSEEEGKEKEGVEGRYA